MRINPIYKKEMKSMARSQQLTILTVVFSGVLACMALIILYIISKTYIKNGMSPYKSMMYFYMMILSLEVCLLCLFVPSVAGASIAGEREKQTLDILLSTKMSVPKIIIGKLLSCISLAVLLGVSSVPVLAVTVLYGGIGLVDIYQSVMYVAFLVLFVGCIGVFCSCRLKKTTTATIVAYGTILAMTAGTGFFVMVLNYLDRLELGMLIIVHGLSYLLLLNPAVTYISILAQQIAESETVYNYLIAMGIHPWIAEYWGIISIAVQSLFMVILIFFAVKYLDPQNERFNAGGKNIKKA